MTYLLDTNIIIATLKNKSGRGDRYASRLGQELLGEVVVCAIVEAELFHGAEKYGQPERRRAAIRRFLAPYESLPFDTACVPHYARIRHYLEKQGQVIGANDLLIAATALAYGLTLVTHNDAEFRRVPELKVEDWA